MDHAHHAAAMPVEKRLERGRAAEQVQAVAMAVLADVSVMDDAAQHEYAFPLNRSAAKYLLTASDRLRRSALKAAWEAHHRNAPSAHEVLCEVREWDDLMRLLSSQFGVVHPFAEMVETLSLGEQEMQLLGVAVKSLHNGDDLLAL